jgi:hypothetical protein
LPLPVVSTGTLVLITGEPEGSVPLAVPVPFVGPALVDADAVPLVSVAGVVPFTEVPAADCACGEAGTGAWHALARAGALVDGPSAPANPSRAMPHAIAPLTRTRLVEVNM